MRYVNTGIYATQARVEMLKSVRGQLSDGIWENDNRYLTYWACSDIDVVDGQIVIEVEDSLFYYGYWKTYKNQYYGKTDAQIIRFFKNKLVTIWKIFCEDNEGVDKKLAPNNETVCRYMGYKETIRAKDIYELSQLLKIAEEVR